jgi:hypothetical protein
MNHARYLDLDQTPYTVNLRSRPAQLAIRQHVRHEVKARYEGMANFEVEEYQSRAIGIKAWVSPFASPQILICS